MSFYNSIAHNPSQVRWGGVHASAVTEWSPACLHKLPPGGYHTNNLRTPQMEEVLDLINISPTNRIQIFDQHEFFLCVLQMILLTKIKNLDVGTGAPQ